MSAMGGSFQGWRILDLFAGSGALGLECLSRGAEHATFVERARSSLAVLRRNVEILGAAPRCTVVQDDVLAFLDAVPTAPGARPHAALADPPYGQGFAPALLERFSVEPFANVLWLEHGTGESVPELPGLQQRRYGDTTLSILHAPDVHAPE